MDLSVRNQPINIAQGLILYAGAGALAAHAVVGIATLPAAALATAAKVIELGLSFVMVKGLQAVRPQMRSLQARRIIWLVAKALSILAVASVSSFLLTASFIHVLALLVLGVAGGTLLDLGMGRIRTEIDYRLNDSDYNAKRALARAKSGHFDAARAVALGIRNAFLRSETMGKIAVVQAKAGDINGAKTTAGYCEDTYGKAACYVSIAEAYAEAGKIDDALATAENIASIVRDSYYIAEAYSGIAGVQAKAGNLEGAKTTATLSLNWGNSLRITNPYISIAKGQAEAGDINGARETLKTAIKTTENIGRSSDAHERAFAYIKLANARAEIGDVEGFKVTISLAKIEALRVPVSSYDIEQSRILLEIAISQARVGDIEASKETAGVIIAKSVRVNAYSEIAKVQKESGKNQDAIATLRLAQEVVGGMDSDYEKVLKYRHLAEAFKEIAAAQTKAGKKKWAKETLKLAKETFKFAKEIEKRS